VLNSIAREDYFLGFFFWLDLVSTISLITDIGWIWDEITGTADDPNAADAQQASKLARGSRGAKIGSRAGRIARVIRLIRLIRVVKLYKSANYAMLKENDGRRKSVAPPTEQRGDILETNVQLHVEASDKENSARASRNVRDDETLIRLNRTAIDNTHTHFEDFKQHDHDDDEDFEPEDDGINDFEVP